MASLDNMTLVVDNCSLLNNTSEECQMEMADIGAGEIVIPIIFVILMIVGVLGNGTLIFTVLRNKSMRNVPNILIVSLSCGDMILLTMSAPFSAVVFGVANYPFPSFICKLNEYLQTLSVGVSVFTLTALSGDRYVAIVHPMSKHKGESIVFLLVLLSYLVYT